MYCYKCGLPADQVDLWYGLHHSCFKDWFKIPHLEKFQNIVSRRRSDDPLDVRGINSSFFHGKFRKYSSTLGSRRYILKVEERDFPELPATEFLCNQLFQLLGVSIPPFYLIYFENAHACFVTENFMEHFPGSSLVHIYRFIDKGIEYNCENLLKIIEDKTERLTAKEDFIYLTLADSLIGNNDRHGRNLGLVQSASGFTLAPFYDNPSYLGTEVNSLLGADHQPAGAIWTRAAQSPTMRDYVHEWERLGFGYVVDRFRSAVSLQDIESLVRNSFLTSKRQEALLRLILKRSNELCL